MSVESEEEVVVVEVEEDEVDEVTGVGVGVAVGVGVGVGVGATEQVVVITGVRRAGKSTILKQYIHNKIKNGEERKSFLYVNLEEPKFRSELSLEFLQMM